MAGHSILIAFIFFILGTVTGSFVNVLIWRLPRRGSIIFPGSHCPSCNARIKFYHNIPIISYIMLRGKCRHCGTRISPRYIFVEALVGIAYAVAYLAYAPYAYAEVVRMMLVFPMFVAIAFIDWRHWVIPDELTISIAAVGIASAPFMGGWRNVIPSIIGCAVGMLLFWLVAIIGKRAFHKDALGEGDIFLMGAIGLLVGWAGVLLTIFMAALLGTIGGLMIIVIRKCRKQSENISLIPFGPFIVAATLITMIYGDKIIRAYLSLFRLL